MLNIKIGCVIMAAGNSLRFKGNKLETNFNNKPMYQNIFDTIPKEKYDKIIVVSQYTEILKTAEIYKFNPILNEHPEYGISHTIKLGLKELKDFNAVMFTVADQPMLKKQSIEKEIELYKNNPEKIICLSSNGKRGNPCIFPNKFFNELFKLENDNGGNIVIKNHPHDIILCEVDQNELKDIDTKSDLNEIYNHNK